MNRIGNASWRRCVACWIYAAIILAATFQFGLPACAQEQTESKSSTETVEDLSPQEMATLEQAKRSMDSAIALYNQGKASDAIRLAQSSLEMYKDVRGGKHPSTAMALYDLGIFYEEAGDYPAAKRTVEESLAIRREIYGEKHSETADSLHTLGSVLRAMGDYAAARSAYEQALAIRKEVCGRHHADTGQTHNSLGLLLNAMGDYKVCFGHFAEAWAISEIVYGERHPNVAAVLNNIGHALDMGGASDEAKKYYDQALEIRKEAFGENHPDVASSLDSLSGLLVRARDYAGAKPYYEQSLSIRMGTLGPRHPLTAVALDNLGTLCSFMLDFENSRKYYEEALAIRREVLGSNHPDTASSLDHLSSLHVALENWPQAGTLQDESRRIARKHIVGVLPALSADEQLAYLNENDEAYFHGCLSLGLLRKNDPQFVHLSTGWLLNGKAVAQEALAQQALLGRGSDDPQSVPTVHELLSVRRRLATLSYTAPESGKEKERREQLEQLETQEQELSRRLADLSGQSNHSNSWVEVDTLRKAIPSGSVFIDIVRFDLLRFRTREERHSWLPPRYVAWIIPPVDEGDVQIVELGRAGGIDRAIQAIQDAMRAAIATGDSESEAQLGTIADQGEEQAEVAIQEPFAALAERVLAPLVECIGATKEIILSPDASLWLIPWAALPLAEGRYAIEEYDIRYVVSGRDLVTPSLVIETKRPIIMADPNYDSDSEATEAATRAVFRSATPKTSQNQVRSVGPTRSEAVLPLVLRLPGTLAEANAIKSRLAAYTNAEPILYTDQYALEQVFKALRRPKVLVLSTHGFFLPDQEVSRNASASEMPVKIESHSRSAPLTIDGKAIENPLLRCGLLFAGCNRDQSAKTDREKTDSDHQDDGILTGMEIVGTDLRGTELVVLSACQTGLGKVRNGEGVAGLRQAFQLAGAESVVATLWQIPDRDSVRLMSEFFTNLAIGQSKSESLRNAQLTMIETRRQRYGAAHPFYWAAFTLTGR